MSLNSHNLIPIVDVGHPPALLALGFPHTISCYLLSASRAHSYTLLLRHKVIRFCVYIALLDSPYAYYCLTIDS